MARIRTIKPEFPLSESMSRVSREARLTFILLWPQCDDHGKFRGASRMLASLLFPYDDDAPSLIDGWLQELEQAGAIQRYEVDDNHYLRVVNWLEHQKVDRPSASRFPDPRECSREIDTPRECSSLDQGSRIEEGSEDARARAGPTQVPEPIAAAARAAAASWAAPIQSDFKPRPEDLAWARIARPDLTEATIGAETACFVNHAIANNRTSHSWPHNWRNWITKAKAGEVARPGVPSPASAGMPAPEPWEQRLKDYKRGGFWSPMWGPRPESGHCQAPADLLADWHRRNPAAKDAA